MQCQAQQHAEADAHDDAVQNGGGEVDPVVAAAVDEGVHGTAAGAAQEQHHGDGLELHGDGHDGTFVGKQAEDQLGEQVDGGRHEGGGAQGKAEAGHHDPGHPLILLGAHILAHHGGAGGVHRVGDQVADGTQLVDDTRHGRHRHAVGIDPGVDEQLGKMDGGAFDGHGDAQLGQGGEILHFGMEEVAEGHLKIHLLPAAPQKYRAADERKGLAEYGGDGGAHGAQMEAPHQHDVQEDIHNGGQGDEYKGVLGVAHAPQHGRHHVVAVDKDQTQDAHGGIGQRFIPGGGGRVHQGQHLLPEDQADRSQNRRAAQQKGEHGAHEGAHLSPLAGADVLGDDDLAGVGKAHGHKGEKAGHVAADGHGRKAHRAHHLSHDDHVSHVVDHLQQVSQQQGRGKPQKLLGHAAFCKISYKSLFRHGAFSFLSEKHFFFIKTGV